MPTLAEIYERLAPRVRTLAGQLYHDHDLTAVSAAVRLAGNDYMVRLVREDGDYRLEIRSPGARLYRGRLAGFYGAAERAGRAA